MNKRTLKFLISKTTGKEIDINLDWQSAFQGFFVEEIPSDE